LICDQPVPRSFLEREIIAMTGLEGAVLIPILILGSATIIYYGLRSARARQLEARRRDDTLRVKD
jgi:hypothetical protein